MSLINTEIKPFKATAYHNGKFVPVTHETLKGKWSVLVFYPADFTFVCPTELGDLADNYGEFKKLGVEIYGVSTDTHFAHKAWHDTSDTIVKVQYPLVGDPTAQLARNFEVLIEEEGLALRGTFVIDPKGLIKIMEVHDNGIGRDARELLRKVKAAQYVASHPGEVCPAKWTPGAQTLGAVLGFGRQDLKAMLDGSLKAQLKGYLQRMSQPVEIAASVDDGEGSREMLELLADIASASELITIDVRRGDAQLKPSFALHPPEALPRVRFAGLPMGHEFTSLVLALLQTGGYPPKVDPDIVERIRNLDGDYRFETVVSLTCQSCPDVVQALNTMAVLNPNVHHTMIDGALFQDEVQRRQVLAVPAVFLNGQPFGQGRMELNEILAKLDAGSAAATSPGLPAKAPFDVLVIGGGPAGAAAAIYAARKGIRTGIAAERLGGQLLDTLGIENFVSVTATEGHALASGLERHVGDYEVDIMSLQRAEALIPGDLIDVRLAGGGALRAKSVIIATGARWREINVPGEREYRNRGVAYCPHCDGPLFKGKRVAVIGGGNSGVEAAIDLAGIVEPCVAARVRRATACRRGSHRKAAQPVQRDHPHRCANHGGDRRRRARQWTRLQGQAERRLAYRGSRRCVRSDRPSAEYGLAEGHSRALGPRRG